MDKNFIRLFGLLIILFVILPGVSSFGELSTAEFITSSYHKNNNPTFKLMNIGKYTRMNRLMDRYRSARRGARASRQDVADVITVLFLLSVVIGAFVSLKDYQKQKGKNIQESIEQQGSSKLSGWAIANMILMGFLVWRLVITIGSRASFGAGFGVILGAAFIIGSIGIWERMNWGRILTKMACLSFILYSVSLVIYVMSFIPGSAVEKIIPYLLVIAGLIIYNLIQFIFLRKFTFKQIVSQKTDKTTSTYSGLTQLLQPLKEKLKEGIR